MLRWLAEEVNEEEDDCREEEGGECVVLDARASAPLAHGNAAHRTYFSIHRRRTRARSGRQYRWMQVTNTQAMAKMKMPFESLVKAHKKRVTMNSTVMKKPACQRAARPCLSTSEIQKDASVAGAGQVRGLFSAPAWRVG